MVASDECDVRIYAIKQRKGTRRSPNDPYIFITFTCTKSMSQVLKYFKREVEENDSKNHNDVSRAIKNIGLSKVYMKSMGKSTYNFDRTREFVRKLQNKNKSMIKYP
jgi:hypothetical protein